MKILHHCFLSALLVLFLTLGAFTAAFAQITPSQDSYTNTAATTTNFGAAPTLGVVSSASSIQTTYIQFNLSSVPSGYTGTNVAKATLKLFVNSVTKAGSLNVDYVNGSWSEKTITSSLAPALGSSIASSVPVTTANANDYLLIDVTAAVGEWLNGSQANDGLALVANSGLSVTVDSKENAAQSHPAELDIVFTSGGTISGVTTAAGSGLAGGGTSGKLNLSLTKSCSSNQVLQWNGSAWVCASAGTGTISGITTVSGSGLTGGGASGALSIGLQKTCSTSQVLQWNGSSWVCASMATGTVSRVTAGTDLTGGGTAGNVTLNLDTTKVPLLNANNNFTGIQTITGSAFAINNVPSGTAIVGNATATTGEGWGVLGESASSDPAAYGVLGQISAPDGSGIGVYGIGPTGVQGTATTSVGAGGGVFNGYSAPANSGLAGTVGLLAFGGSGDASSSFGWGADGIDATGGSGYYGGNGVSGTGGSGTGVDDGVGGNFTGGSSATGSTGDGIDAVRGSGFAGNFTGDVTITGNLSATTKNFKIDHPLDPANKYLVHASVESSEMINIYTGNVVTDTQGEATVTLPDWFEVLNTDFRYQLTVVGQFAQAIVGHKVENHEFRIKTNAPNVEVSWQVTGVRQDAYAKAHPLVVEQEKEARLKGFYIHPELYGAPAEKQIEWARHPTLMKQMKERRAKAAPQLKAMATKKP